MSRRLLSLTTAAALVAGALAGGTLATTSAGTAAVPHSATAAKHPAKKHAAKPGTHAKPATRHYRATIKITAHGIPHITAKTFPDLAYGEGWAAASETTCELMESVAAARGNLSRYLGPDATYDTGNTTMTNLANDTLMRDMHNRKVVERLLQDKQRGPSPRMKRMVTAEAAGIDRWLRTHKVTNPACAGKPWVKPDVTSTDIWYVIYMANLIASTLNIGSAIVDAAPPSTTGRQAAQTAQPAQAEPTSPAEVTKAQRRAIRAGLGRDDAVFGSNATAAGKDITTTGSGMLLGNPHFPWQGRYRFTQQQLTIPGKYDVAGGSLVGAPVINIGWNSNVAWSHTVSTASRFTLYQYTTAGSPTTYKNSQGKTVHVQTRTVKVPVKTASGVKTVTKHLYRTHEGYVLSAPSMLMGWSATSFWALRDANAEHLRLLDTFLNMGFAKNVTDLLRRQDRGGGMPWTNTIAADRAGNVLYADHSVTPHVTNAQMTQCQTPTGAILRTVAAQQGENIVALDGNRADGACRWGTDKDSPRPGVFGSKEMPSEVRTDWVINSNDSYWLPNPAQPLEGYASIIGCEKCERSMRTQATAHYLLDDIAKGVKETPEIFASHEFDDTSLAATRAKADGKLDALCALTGETDACQVLHDWDGTYNPGSNAGAEIFADFLQTATDTIWANPWSLSDPLNTPNTLKTDQTTADKLKAAIEEVKAGDGLASTWGDAHYSQLPGHTDRIPVPGGPGDGYQIGLSNVTGGPGVVTKGSSHIQAIAFTPNGGVEARTMLTYSQSTDPTSRYSEDQTKLFSRSQWVDFAWTPQQVKEGLVRTIRLKGK